MLNPRKKSALQALRAWRETAQVPVIALSAAVSEVDKKRGERAGFHRYLTKPLRIEELELALKGLLPSAWTRWHAKCL